MRTLKERLAPEPGPPSPGPARVGMSLPPRSFGDRGGHTVALERRADGRWLALVDGRPLGSAFDSEPAARAAVAREVLRLDATAHALLTRVRRSLTRKQRS